MGKTIVEEFDCGGYGQELGRMVRRRVGAQPGLWWRAVESSTPEGIPESRCIGMNPQVLPGIPTKSVGEALRMSPVKDDEEYAQYRSLVSARGLAQAPFMSSIAAFEKLSEMKEAIETDVRALAEAVGGADRCVFLTLASGLGGTGTPAARVAGIALRLAARGACLPREARWIHVFITSAVLGDACRSRRTLALERRQLEELEALMAPGAALRVPGQLDPVRLPGPDEMVLIASSPEAPRTLSDAADELAAIIEHWLK